MKSVFGRRSGRPRRVIAGSSDHSLESGWVGVLKFKPLATILSLSVVSVCGATKAQTLLTSPAGYAGPVLDLGSFSGPYYDFTAGPVALPGGITYTSSDSYSLIGVDLLSDLGDQYQLGANGSSGSPIIGANDSGGIVTLTFATPVAAFGAGFNYAPGYGSDPTISAYDASDDLIASYDLAILAPISTPGAVNRYAFRGIDGDGALISSFTFSGSYIIASPTATAPEPGAWVLMLAGVASIGAVMRAGRTPGLRAA